jgi:hypothetical protein
LEKRGRADHALRLIRTIANTALFAMLQNFDALTRH